MCKNKYEEDILAFGEWDNIILLEETNYARLFKCVKKIGSGVPCFENKVGYYVFCSDNSWHYGCDYNKAYGYYNSKCVAEVDNG